MIVKLIRMARGGGGLSGLHDNIDALTRYVVDADPWALALAADQDRIRSLSEYLINARNHGVEPGEKVGYIGTRNLEMTGLPSRQMEMLAIARAAPRVEFPVLHIIVSWSKDERPRASQLEDTVDTLLAVTGLSGCKAIFAEHTNTANAHLHIAAVRIDPANLRAAGSDWLIQDLHQSLAILEERHGWSAEPNALYYARRGAVYDANARRFTTDTRGRRVVDPTSEVIVRDAALHVVGRRDWRGLPADVLERRTDILRARERARSWVEFHQLLDLAGASYRSKGSGARVHVGLNSAKASTVSPTLALKQMPTDWGPFVPHSRDHDAAFDAYRAAHAAQLKSLRDDRDEAQTALDQWARTNLASVAAMRSKHVDQAIRAERDAAQKALNDAFAAAIRICTKGRLTQADEWYAADSPAEPPPVDSPKLLLPGADAVEAPWSPPAGLRAEDDGWRTRYYDAADRLVFVDHRNVVIVHRPSHQDGLDAALRMAAERWGVVRVSGSAQFKHACAERAAAMGISVVDRDNRPLEVAVAKAPKPGQVATSGIPAPMTVPDHRADPARQAAIEQVLGDLARFRHLPLRRRKGALEVVVDRTNDVFSPETRLRAAALFDEDPVVQKALEIGREQTVEVLESRIREWPVELAKAEIAKSLRGDEELLRAFWVGFDDPDVQAMLERVAEFRTLREREMRPAGRGNMASEADVDRGGELDHLALLGELFHYSGWDARDWSYEAIGMNNAIASASRQAMPVQSPSGPGEAPLLAALDPLIVAAAAGRRGAGTAR